MFYPEGGGQPADKGNFSWEGKKSKVVNVQKIGDIVIHELEGEIPKVKTTVIGEIDGKYRDSLSRHHSATHIDGAAARKILGLHVWQTGAQKEATKARLDITHHERLDVETLNEIERCANQTIMNDYEIISKFLPRSEAELALHMQLTYKQAVELAEEQALKVLMEGNNYELIKKYSRKNIFIKKLF